LLEPLIVFERVLAADPAGAYARMDFQSRELYRQTVAHFAAHSDCTELEIASSQSIWADERRRTGIRSPPGLATVSCRLLPYCRRRRRVCAPAPASGFPSANGCRLSCAVIPTSFYLGGIETFTLLIVIAIMTPVYNNFNSFLGRIAAIILLLLPCSQSAVEVMNYLTTRCCRAHPAQARLLRRDSDDCLTMVAVPRCCFMKNKSGVWSRS